MREQVVCERPIFQGRRLKPGTDFYNWLKLISFKLKTIMRVWLQVWYLKKVFTKSIISENILPGERQQSNALRELYGTVEFSSETACNIKNQRDS